jgi:AcrR family transcriptional regulator
MPRLQADDYDEKKSKILDTAAMLFARHGYAGSKMEQIAEVRGVAKSMLYHYFKRKEDVLFEILQDHISRLMGVIRKHVESSDRSDSFTYFRGFIAGYLEPSSTARARHVVALHDMRYLTPSQKQKQIKDERVLLTLVEGILRDINPRHDKNDYRVYALLLMGMLNSVELWFKSSGRLTSNELYDIVAHYFLSGFLDEERPPIVQRKRLSSAPKLGGRARVSAN